MNFWRNIPRPIIGLSPMDGVTDPSFRFITAKHADDVEGVLDDYIRARTDNPKTVQIVPAIQ